MKLENLPSLRIYLYDRFFCFTEERLLPADFDGFGRTIYVLPPNATIIEPPEEEGKVAVHDPQLRVWTLLESHRGEVWFNNQGEAVTIERPGNPADFGLRRHWGLQSSF